MRLWAYPTNNGLGKAISLLLIVSNDWGVGKRNLTDFSFASGLMAKNKIQNNHNVALERLENEIAAELQAKRDNQNRQLQMELERSLLVWALRHSKNFPQFLCFQDQKKQFLSRLAVICQLSPDQINNMTERAKRRIGGTRS